MKERVRYRKNRDGSKGEEEVGELKREGVTEEEKEWGK